MSCRKVVFVGDPSTTSERRLADDEQSVDLAVGDEREALRRHAVQSRVQARRLVTKARKLAERSRELSADDAELAARQGELASRSSEVREERALVRAARVAAKTTIYAGLAALLGLLAEWMQDPPLAVTLIIVATLFGVLVVSDDPRRRRS
jgi:hypothetical protein